MIQITRINRHTLVLNSDLIEQIESTPDTVIHLVNGQKMLVLESSEEIVRRVVEFRRSLLREGPGLPAAETVKAEAVKEAESVKEDLDKDPS